MLKSSSLCLPIYGTDVEKCLQDCKKLKHCKYAVS